MKRKSNELKIVRHFIIDGKEYLESEVSEEMLATIRKELGRRFMETLGYEAVEKDTEGTA